MTESIRQPKLGSAAGQMPGRIRKPLISNIIEASNLDDMEGVDGDDAEIH